MHFPRYLLPGLAALCLMPMAPADAVEFSYAGALEFDGARTSLRVGGECATHTESAISTLELDLATAFTPTWHADLVLLAEDIGATDHNDYLPAAGAEDERPDKLHIDAFTLGYADENIEAAAGRMTLPFGVFENSLLSDPQTLEVGETATEAGLWGLYRRGDWYLGAGAFAGNLRSSAPDEGGYLGFVGWEGDAVEFRLGYLSAQHAGEHAPGLWDLAAVAAWDAWFASAEFVGALADARGQRPRAVTLEGGREFGARWSAALRYQQTSRFSVLDGGDGNYEEWAVGAIYAFNQYISVGLEYANGDEGDPRQRTTIARLAVGF